MSESVNATNPIPINTGHAPIFFSAGDTESIRSNLSMIFFIGKIILFVFTVILLPAIGYFVYVVFDLRASVNTIPDKVRAEVAVASSALRTELQSGSKDARQELFNKSEDMYSDIQTLRNGISAESRMKSCNCEKRFREAIFTYKHYTDKKGFNGLPDEMKASLTKLYVEALVSAEDHFMLTTNEIDEFSKNISKEITHCNGRALLNLYVLYTASGDLTKANSCIMQSVDQYLRSEDIDANTVANLYAHCLVNITLSSNDNSKDNASVCIKLLTEMQKRKFVLSRAIYLQVDRIMGSQFIKNAKVRKGKQFLDSISLVKEQLSTKRPEYVKLKVVIDNKDVWYYRESEVNDNTLKPPTGVQDIIPSEAPMTIPKNDNNKTGVPEIKCCE